MGVLDPNALGSGWLRTALTAGRLFSGRLFGNAVTAGRLYRNAIAAYSAAVPWVARRQLQLLHTYGLLAAHGVVRAFDSAQAVRRREPLLSQLVVGTVAGVVSGLMIAFFLH
jgi:hypothetical protein